MRDNFVELKEYEENEKMKNLTFYHGTTDFFKIDEIKATTDTGILREGFRDKHKDMVFITTSLLSAKKYAMKAALMFGGNPVVYEVTPDYDTLFHKMDNEYLTTNAKIKKRVS